MTPIAWVLVAVLGLVCGGSAYVIWQLNIRMDSLLEHQDRLLDRIQAPHVAAASAPARFGETPVTEARRYRRDPRTGVQVPIDVDEDAS